MYYHPFRISAEPYPEEEYIDVFEEEGTTPAPSGEGYYQPRTFFGRALRDYQPYTSFGRRLQERVFGPSTTTTTTMAPLPPFVPPVDLEAAPLPYVAPVEQAAPLPYMAPPFMAPVMPLAPPVAPIQQGPYPWGAPPAYGQPLPQPAPLPPFPTLPRYPYY